MSCASCFECQKCFSCQTCISCQGSCETCQVCYECQQGYAGAQPTPSQGFAQPSAMQWSTLMQVASQLAAIAQQLSQVAQTIMSMACPRCQIRKQMGWLPQPGQEPVREVKVERRQTQVSA